MVDFISSLLLVRFQQKIEGHGGSHLQEASIKANHDEARSHAAKSHHVTHLHSTIKYAKKKIEKKFKNTRDKLALAANRENVACMKPFGETDILEQ